MCPQRKLFSSKKKKRRPIILDSKENCSSPRCNQVFLPVKDAQRRRKTADGEGKWTSVQTRLKERIRKEKKTVTSIVAQWTFCALPTRTNEGQKIGAIAFFSSLAGFEHNIKISCIFLSCPKNVSWKPDFVQSRFKAGLIIFIATDTDFDRKSEKLSRLPWSGCRFLMMSSLPYPLLMPHLCPLLLLCFK